jgi:flagellar L-ring protein precursor FlgH
MNRHHARLLALGIATSGWVGSAFGQTQTTQHGQPPGPGPASAPDGRQKLPRAMSNDAADRAAAGMRANGSSLLKATMHARQDPGQARLADLSFSAVPEPIPRTLRKHDQVTIIVREESEVRSKGTTELKKEAEFEARLEEWISLKIHNMEIEGGAQGPNPPAIRATGKRDFKGEGRVDRSDKFTTRVQAEVVDVKPNGTLVLQARSHIRTDDEDRYFVLTGTCRVEDVTADNSILSSQLYDKDLVQRNKGGIRNTTKRGWLGNLLDAITPF